MASKKSVKKDLRKMIEDVVEECYSVQLYNPSKKEVSDKLIDEAVIFYDDTVSKIQSGKSKSDARKTFNEIEEKAIYFVENLNKIQA